MLKTADLTNLGKDYSEIILDSFISDETLKNIPLVNTIVGLCHFGDDFRRNIFAKKLCRFLFELEETTLEQRSRIIERVNSSDKYQTKVGEFTLELLDKIDSNGKPEILGRLFCAVLKNKLDYSEYLRLAFIVQNSFYFDLVALGKSVRLDGLVFESKDYDSNWDSCLLSAARSDFC